MKSEENDLDYEYSPSQWSHRMAAAAVIDSHIAIVTQESKKSRETVEFEEASYGDSDEQKLHIFGSKSLPAGAPITVYIHGGYWQAVSLKLSSFVVKPLVEAGSVVVAMGYDLAPEVGMTEIVSQVKKAIVFVLHIAKRRQSKGVYLIGHSAGAHLASMMLSINWLQECMINSSLIKGAMLVSGIYDLRPIAQTYVNKPLQMTDEEAWKNSPENVVKSIISESKGRKIIVVTAQHDSNAFHKQATHFYQSLTDGGASDIKTIDVPNMDHFDVIESLSDSEFTLTKEVVKMIQS